MCAVFMLASRGRNDNIVEGVFIFETLLLEGAACISACMCKYNMGIISCDGKRRARRGA